MHPFALIPLVAVLVAAAFVAVSAVWDKNRRATGSMTEIFVCLCGWALVDLCGQLESDPAAAIVWLRLVHLPALVLSVCVVRLVIQMVPRASSSLEPVARVGLVLAVAAGLGATIAPGVVLGATPTHWGGWIPQYGVVSIALIPMGCVLPAIAAYRVARLPDESERSFASNLERLRVRAVTAAVAISVAAALSTEFVFPMLQIPFPRMGALITVLASATLWIQLLHRSDDLTIAPQATARAVLAELHDGVALVGPDGRILTANPALAAIVGHSREALIGRPLSDLVDIPFESIREGLDEREMRLATASSAPLPISLSASCVRNRRGATSWLVVVFRDLRSVDALRRRLMASGRLAALGELAAGIAHEVNNPITFIRSDLNFLRGRLPEIEAQFTKASDDGADLFVGSEARIGAALEGIERVAQVVDDVREFAYIGADGSTAGDPAAIIASAVRLARLERREDVTLRISDTEMFMPVVAGQDFKQVILALLRVMTMNSKSGAELAIDVIVDREFLRVGLRTNRFARSSEDQIERFEQAGRDVLESSGSDLGLAMAIQLVHQLGGAVDIEVVAPEGLGIVLSWPFDRVEDGE
jgi:PAS domain S-box-containing protein